MAITYNRFLIDVNSPINDVVTIKQNDADSRYFDVNLYSNSSPIDLTGNSVKIYFLKPDSTAVYIEGEITDATTGRCQFLIAGQTLTVAGTLQAEISIWNGSTQILSTQTFNIYIQPSIRDDNAPPSTNEFGVLVTLFQNIQNTMNTLNDVLSGFDSLEVSTTAAQTAAEAAETVGNTVNGKIGATNDTQSSSTTSGSVFAKLNYLVAQVSSYLSNIYNNCLKIGSTADTGGTTTTGTAMGKLNHLIGNSGIKSIQRGNASITDDETIAISAVNVSKSFVLLDGGIGDAMPYLYSLSSTSFRINMSGSTIGVKCSWQVVEFY